MKRQCLFTEGQRIMLKANKDEGRSAESGRFQEMSSARTAIVYVEPSTVDDDGVREVALDQIEPFYNHPTDQLLRARHVARLFQNGLRVFRVDRPDGALFSVTMVDTANGVAAGRKFKRKTVQIVPLHNLWPKT